MFSSVKPSRAASSGRAAAPESSSLSAFASRVITGEHPSDPTQASYTQHRFVDEHTYIGAWFAIAASAVIWIGVISAVVWMTRG